MHDAFYEGLHTLDRSVGLQRTEEEVEVQRLLRRADKSLIQKRFVECPVESV
jgi:hypothetical protein